MPKPSEARDAKYCAVSENASPNTPSAMNNQTAVNKPRKISVSAHGNCVVDYPRHNNGRKQLEHGFYKLEDGAEYGFSR